MVRLSSPVFLALASVCGSSLALNPIIIKGTKFFDSVTRDQFFIKGVAYQPRTLSSIDPLATPEDCRRDFALMKDLGLNTVRVYQVNTSLNHDGCMNILEEYGMYLLLDLASTSHSVIRTSPEYNTNIWNGVRATVDAFQGYTNTLAFFAGNEVTNDKNTTDASPYVKALVRDIKTYIASNSQRRIPVGYANNDDPDIRLQVQAYLNCGPEAERIDFFGINLYEWCGEGATYKTSGYVERTNDISSYSVPVFLSEFGCNLVSPRTFPEVKSIFGPDMTGSWSGGVVYEWSQEENNYGLVHINQDNTVEILADYNNLKAVLASVHPIGVTMDAFTEQRPASACPAITPAWQASTILPPTPSSSACECMMSSLGCAASDQASNSASLGDLLNTVCGMTSCEDIGSNGKTGVYGKYSFCSPAQKLSYIYNSYYMTVGQNSADSCNFQGNAALAVAATSSDQGCAATTGIGASTRATYFTGSATGLSHEGSMFGLLVLVAVLVVV
ncbi:1,3-beta-glucanosyltransferase gas1 [Podila horticola]|nr:1,3-beta-glucanosyltransferase gas1 [Podila horticola]